MSDSILIPFKSMEIEAKSMKVAGSTFYQATNTWKMISNRDTQKPSIFLLDNDTRKFMIKAYLNSAVSVVNSRLSKLDGFDITDDVQLDAYLTATKNKRLPAEIEKHFVHSPSNTKLGTFFEKALYTKYAMYLDKDLELVVINLFNQMQEFSQLPASEQVDILTDTIIAIDADKQKAREITYDVATQEKLNRLPSEKMRAFGKLVTEELTDVLKHFSLAGKYGICHNTVYKNLFGHKASEIRELMEVSDGATARNFLTKYAYSFVTMIEQRLTYKLEVMLKKGIKSLTIEKLDEIVADLAKAMSADLQDPDFDLDFLIGLNKNREKLIEVSLDAQQKTKKTESVIVSEQMSLEFPTEKATNKTPKALALQPSLFDDTEF